MKANLILQLALETLTFEQATQPGGGDTYPAHASSFVRLVGSMVRKRSMIDDMRLQSSVSFASCLRPAAVMA